jgi:hypothetical protein
MTMIETIWRVLPYPFVEVATPKPIHPLDFVDILERLLEDTAGMAGVLASAAAQPETDLADVLYALRVLAEHLHATVALWRQWRQQVDRDEA